MSAAINKKKLDKARRRIAQDEQRADAVARKRKVATK